MRDQLEGVWEGEFVPFCKEAALDVGFGGLVFRRGNCILILTLDSDAALLRIIGAHKAGMERGVSSR